MPSGIHGTYYHGACIHKSAVCEMHIAIGTCHLTRATLRGVVCHVCLEGAVPVGEIGTVTMTVEAVERASVQCHSVQEESALHTPCSIALHIAHRGVGQIDHSERISVLVTARIGSVHTDVLKQRVHRMADVDALVIQVTRPFVRDGVFPRREDAEVSHLQSNLSASL